MYYFLNIKFQTNCIDQQYTGLRANERSPLTFHPSSPNPRKPPARDPGASTEPKPQAARRGRKDAAEV